MAGDEPPVAIGGATLFVPARDELQPARAQLLCDVRQTTVLLGTWIQLPRPRMRWSVPTMTDHDSQLPTSCGWCGAVRGADNTLVHRAGCNSALFPGLRSERWREPELTAEAPCRVRADCGDPGPCDPVHTIDNPRCCTWCKRFVPEPKLPASTCSCSVALDPRCPLHGSESQFACSGSCHEPDNCSRCKTGLFRQSPLPPPRRGCPSCGDHNGVCSDLRDTMVTCCACGVEVTAEEFERGAFAPGEAPDSPLSDPDTVAAIHAHAIDTSDLVDGLMAERDALRAALADLIRTPKTMTRQQAYRNAERAINHGR